MDCGSVWWRHASKPSNAKPANRTRTRCIADFSVASQALGLKWFGCEASLDLVGRCTAGAGAPSCRTSAHQNLHHGRRPGPRCSLLHRPRLTRLHVVLHGRGAFALRRVSVHQLPDRPGPAKRHCHQFPRNPPRCLLDRHSGRPCTVRSGRRRNFQIPALPAQCRRRDAETLLAV
jgi:hypothetical protein